MALPLPPLRLAARVGGLDPRDPWTEYARLGRAMRERIVGGLPDGWSWEGRRALDFGSGAGRVLRWFEPEAESAELWGCDIDEPSIEWLRAHLSPPFDGFVVDELPPIPKPGASFDLIWACSVFTHLAASWSAWLAELHRVLADGGLLMASFLGRDVWETIERTAWDEEATGMCVLRAGQPWSLGGPIVYHSEWWLRERWGRGFDVLALEPGAEPPFSHGWVVLRKRPGTLTPAELERPGDDPARELRAANRNLDLLHAEDARIRPGYLRDGRLRRAIARARTRARRLIGRPPERRRG